MEKFIPYDKLSKKKKRELDTQRRGSWAMSPVTRKPANPKAYDRRKARQMEDPSGVLSRCAGHGTVLTGESPVTGIYRQV